MTTGPANLDIDIYKDRDFKKVFTLKDDEEAIIDLDGWTAAAQIRPTLGSATLIANFDIDITSASGIITMTIDDSITKDIEVVNPITLGSTITSSNMAWDMVVNDSVGDRYSLIEGKCTVHETVTTTAL